MMAYFGYPTNLFEGNKAKGYIFKFLWLQGICKSKMAAFKYLINKIDMNHAGQCYLIRDREEGVIGANMASKFPQNTSQKECISTMSALSQKQVKATT